MKTFFNILILLSIFSHTLLSNEVLIDSFLTIHRGTASDQLINLESDIDSLLNTKNKFVSPLIGLYRQRISEDNITQILNSQYFDVILLDLNYDDQATPQAKRLLELIGKNLALTSTKKWAERRIKLYSIIALSYTRSGQKKEALDIRYELSQKIQEWNTLIPLLDHHKYHIQNYYAMSSLFLFDNDEISCQYADSTIQWALRYKEPKYIYSAYSIKYYCKYYSDDGPLLNSIADSCIKYAVVLDDISKKGEAYMHKCNALVVLNNVQAGLEYCELSIAAYEEVSDSSYLSSTLHNMGNVFKKVGDSKRALHFYKKALNYVAQDHIEPYYNSMEAIASELYAMEKYKEAADYYHRFTNDFYNFYQNQLTNKFSEAEAKYQTEKKEAEIVKQNLLISKQENKNKTYVGGIIILLSIGSLLALLSYQRNKRKQEASELALKLEQQRADDLEDVNKLKTDFFNNVSHEIRTPLTLILAPLEDATKKAQHVEIKNELELALSNSKRLLNLTNEILDLSKIDAAKLQVEKDAIDLSAFIKRVFHSFDSLAHIRTISMHDNLEDIPFLYIESDISKLEKILNNLISNAIKYTPENGQISLFIHIDKLQESELIISLKDNGIGIPIAEQSNIFDRYFQASNTKQSSGTGIGLSLVQELVKLLNGNITFASTPSEGSEFIVSLPIVKISPKGRKKINPIKQSPSLQDKRFSLSGHRQKILIVEDDLEMSKYLHSLLSQFYDCDVAYNGKQALQKINQNQYDLISSDIMMPEMDGFKLREIIQDKHNFKEIPFIMLTARAMEEDKLRGLKLGVDDYITKPFSSEEYKARVNNLLKNKFQRDALESTSEDNQIERIFTKSAEDYVIKHLDDPNLTVTNLATHLSYSSRQLRRLLQKYTGLSPVEFIIEIRLQKAFRIIKERRFSTINEVRYEVGIESASYFSNKFKERFGISPSEFENY